ncbi:MAG: ABC-type antimicrobial peptide transport system permease component [Bacteroidetes bacterium]|nr:ABC-type antimicrobial peptide transport system permease component [Bacteroidota bacterium]
MSRSVFELASLKESLAMALHAIRANKLRSALTLLGIVVGIFSIISVMTAMEVLRNSIEVGIMQLGANTFQIDKNDHGFGGHERRFRNRKPITYEQALQVRDKSTLALAVGIESWEFGKIIWWEGQKTNPNVSLAGENLEGIVTNDWTVEHGRGISQQDMDFARNVILLGKPVADKLFPPSLNPVGQTVRVDGAWYEVIGVLQSKGGALGGNQDNLVILPLFTFFQKYGRAARSFHIMVKAKSREVVEDAIEECVSILRAARGLKPGDENDFGYFSNDSLVKQFNEFTLYLRLGVLVVSSIALLAAGVGIMNIMLVSVTERTREIGIRKAIGARKRDVMQQFIIEAVILCQLGGIVGIGMGIIGGNVVSVMLEAPPVIPWDWTAIGFGVCSLVGLIFGIYPAWKASALDPIEALRYE